MLNTATEVVGHNVDFDVKMVRHELWRLQKPDRFEGKPSFCTMLASKPLLRLPAPAWLKNDFKFPKLEETYEFFFQKKFDDAHDALADIRATRACYFALKNHPSQDEIPFDFPTTQQNQP
jgi:DNA polymerase III epsilon subunit-like protein